MATGYEVISEHFRSKYGPVFRRKLSLYSRTLGRIVTSAEACSGPGKALVDKLAEAEDAPRDSDGKVRRHSLPRFFHVWARSAWVDLLDSLPEEDVAEITDPAEEEFRGRVARALHTLFSFSPWIRTGEREIERRSIIAWCDLLAKPGNWAQLGSLLVWMRRDVAGSLHVAARAELFTQTNVNELARLTQRKFAALAERYGVGTKGPECRPGGQWAVELMPAFLQELLPETQGPTAVEAAPPSTESQAAAAEETAPGSEHLYAAEGSYRTP
jgi:hypothetical protein